MAWANTWSDNVEPERALPRENRKMVEQGYRDGYAKEWTSTRAAYEHNVTVSQEKRHGPCTDDFPPENK